MVANARRWPTALQARGLDIVSGGTDSHLMLVDLRRKGDVTGKAARPQPGAAPTSPPTTTACRSTRSRRRSTSGVRVGTPGRAPPAASAPAEFAPDRRADRPQVVDGVAKAGDDNAGVEAEVRNEVLDLTARFPIYS